MTLLGGDPEHVPETLAEAPREPVYPIPLAWRIGAGAGALGLGCLLPHAWREGGLPVVMVGAILLAVVACTGGVPASLLVARWGAPEDTGQPPMDD